MIKLKTLILEDNNLVLTKLEEENAFNVMLKILVPKAVDKYNDWVAYKKNKDMRKKFYRTNTQEVLNKIKKTRRIPCSVEYDCVLRNGHIEFAIEKRMNYHDREEEIGIAYKEPADIGWTNASGWTWYTFNELVSGRTITWF